MTLQRFVCTSRHPGVQSLECKTLLCLLYIGCLVLLLHVSSVLDCLTMTIECSCIMNHW
jgi:hypothetical protein